MRPRCDLFVRSYWKDLAWLELCLAAIAKWCHGFGEVIVVMPQSSRPWVRRSVVSRQTNLVFCGDYGDDYLGQQVTKLNADLFSTADLICHVDSDCIFSRSVRPGDLLEGTKPRITHCPYDELGRHHPWRRPTERFLGWPVANDFMQRPPFVYPRWLYPEVRRHSYAVHGVDIASYVTAQPFLGFSEFNVLGAYAWQRHANEFAWCEKQQQSPDVEYCRWYWSWDGIDDAVRAELAAMLAAYGS